MINQRAQQFFTVLDFTLCLLDIADVTEHQYPSGTCGRLVG
jgi:hypothetical protein